MCNLLSENHNPVVDSLDAQRVTVPGREILVTNESGPKPKTVNRLQDWEYLERSLHRLIAAWGRHFESWEDKRACHRHIWDQAECVRRLRERLVEFPGAINNLDQPVSHKLERLVNTVLLAPSFDDAVDGIYQALLGVLTLSYLEYSHCAHSVHDAPTISALYEIVGIKEQMRLWLRDYRRRKPHTMDIEYSASISRALAECNHLNAALPYEGESAAPAGINTLFRLPLFAVRPEQWAAKYDIRLILSADYERSVEARRLWWCIGYLHEMNLPEDQLRWLYDGHYMPWEWHYDISRHLWDESRHGDSGLSRLLDFGITLEDVGFWSYDEEARAAEGYPDTSRSAQPFSKKEIYDQVFNIGMVAETGHFQLKREAYDDFKAGGDLESAEMMLFDIIDESAHVKYAHKWLPLLAEHAGVDNSDFKEGAVTIRRGNVNRSPDEKPTVTRGSPIRDVDDPACKHYLSLLERMRARQPLSNEATCPPRQLRLV